MPDLRKLVLRFLAETDEPDPHVLAEKIMQELSPYDFEDALRKTLPPYVRVMAHHDRAPIQRMQRQASRSDRPEGWSPWVEAVQRGGLRKSRWYVQGEWKFLYQFTRPDVEAMITEAGKLEESARNKKNAFSRLLFALISTEVETVGDLSDDHIVRALAGVEVPE